MGKDMNFQRRIDNFVASGKLPADIGIGLQQFYQSYCHALSQANKDVAEHENLLIQFLELVVKELQHPHNFEPYHQRQTTPINYNHFGLELFRPLIDFEQSQIYNALQLDKISAQVAKGENVILLANHQTEPDPQAIALLLEKDYQKLAEEIIFVAGDRVISDPLAIPFSRGCNLLCIFSKKHIENPPEKKSEKLQHNKKTMQKLGALLSEGSKIIYVAPSGGRDRPNPEGVLEVAPFDSQSIEMFWLIAQQSKCPTHFYPLALSTYNLLPPPGGVKKELGEPRHAQCTPIFLAFGEEVDMDHFPGSDEADRREKRKRRAEYIWQLVVNEYQRF